MKKFLVVFVFALLIAACANADAEACGLSDFKLYEAPAFVSVDGSDRIVHEYKDVTYYMEPYGTIRSSVPVRDLTATQLFNENLHVPDELIRMFNRSGGMLHIIERPFVWNEVTERTRIEGLSYLVERNGRSVWDIDVYIATGDKLSLESETKNAAFTLAHELGHLLKLQTEKSWTMADEAELGSIVRNESFLTDQFRSSPLHLNVESETFATIVSWVYGNPVPDERYKKFVDRIIGYLPEEVR